MDGTESWPGPARRPRPQSGATTGTSDGARIGPRVNSPTLDKSFKGHSTYSEQHFKIVIDYDCNM
uniref:Uncharacterized protein n=1 Tax=Timema monikensis TaxID=170555 RepID=A0A7R9HR63_9NEOP|nr:unnamed protein product [Timema monikensis]